MSNKILLALILILSPVMNSELHAAKLHALLIGDSYDDELGEAIIEDMNRMHKAVKKISNITKLEKNEVKICGHKATRKNVLEKIKKLDVGPDDVVMAYFSMHGYRSNQKHNRWPDLFFGEDDAGADLEYFAALMEDKNPRLLIVLADCCNVYVSPGEISSTWRKKQPQSANRSVRRGSISTNYQRLFLETCGTIIASGSQPGEPSYGSDEEGSLFTLAFVESLETVTDDEDQANWKEVFDEVKDYIEEEVDDDDEMDEPQTPQYLLNICYS